jgi:hypothetical protein
VATKLPAKATDNKMGLIGAENQENKKLSGFR